MADQVLSKFVKGYFSKWSIPKTAEKPPSDHSEDVITACFTGGAFSGRSSANSRQCMDIADYLAETAPFRKHALDDQGQVRLLKSDHIAIMELCRAIVEAQLFLQDCTAAGADFWKNAYNSLTKLDTGEAYKVLLQNLIWSKAGLDLAILFAGVTDDMRHNIDYSKEIKKRVEECKHVLSRYRSDSAEPRLNIDRDEFYRSVENSQIRRSANESQKRCLDFLVEKSKAYQLHEAGGGGRAEHLFNVFKINPQDIGDDKDILGNGSSGVVYRRSWLGKAVAVKVFNGVQPEDELFKKEASILAGLQNPFIVHMVGWCSSTEKADCAMLVMELAPTDLKEVIDQRPPAIISLPAAVDIMLQISKGMEYLHQKKIIHRDLKPKNVLLEPSSVKQMAAQGYVRVKLCDFGLAKVKERSAKDQSLFTTLKNGTSYYRAPEVLFEDDDVEKSKYTRKVDVYSFAITCSEILAGKTGPACYEKLSSAKKIREKMLENVRPNLPPDCPSHLASLIKSCWDTDPKRRPPFSTVSNTLTYIKFILMRVPHVQRVPYASVVKQFDEDELKRLATEDDEFVYDVAHEEADSNIDMSTLDWEHNVGSSCNPLDKKLEQDFAGTPASYFMKSGESLKTNQWIMCNGYKFVMQEGGILVLYPPPEDGHKAVWASHTEKREEACTCVLEEDGNLVMYDSKNHLVWSSNSGRQKAAYKLELEKGRAVIRGPEGKIWATDESVERPSMRSGQFLVTHQWMLCKGYRLIMQGDSNLVLRSASSNQALWVSHTVHPGGGGYICMLQDDGNLVICDSNYWRDKNPAVQSSNENHVVWSSNSSSSVGASYRLKLDGDGGRAVIEGSDGRLIWATDETVDRPSMRSGQFLAAHHWMLCNGYKLIMQDDGSLVLRSPSQITLWATASASASGMQGSESCRCTLRDDGNLVISDRNGAFLWHSDTAGVVGPHTLRLHNDGRLSIINHGGIPIWER